MYLIGLTLEAQGISLSYGEPSLAILEIRSSSPGIRLPMESMTRSGPLAISGTGWIGDSLFLSLHPENADFVSLRNNWLAEHAESYGRSVATALGWEL